MFSPKANEHSDCAHKKSVRIVDDPDVIVEGLVLAEHDPKRHQRLGLALIGCIRQKSTRSGHATDSIAAICFVVWPRPAMPDGHAPLLTRSLLQLPRKPIVVAPPPIKSGAMKKFAGLIAETLTGEGCIAVDAWKRVKVGQR